MRYDPEETHTLCSLLETWLLFSLLFPSTKWKSHSYRAALENKQTQPAPGHLKKINSGTKNHDISLEIIILEVTCFASFICLRGSEHLGVFITSSSLQPGGLGTYF